MNTKFLYAKEPHFYTTLNEHEWVSNHSLIIIFHLKYFGGDVIVLSKNIMLTMHQILYTF